MQRMGYFVFKWNLAYLKSSLQQRTGTERTLSSQNKLLPVRSSSRIVCKRCMGLSSLMVKLSLKLLFLSLEIVIYRTPSFSLPRIQHCFS